MAVKGRSIFMNKEALAIKGEHIAPADAKDDEYQYCEACGSNISRLNGFVKVIQADTERLLWISVYLRALVAPDFPSETYTD